MNYSKIEFKEIRGSLTVIRVNKVMKASLALAENGDFYCW